MKRQKDLEERIFNFIIRVNRLIKSLPKNQENRWYGFQVMKSSSSMGANHAESTCALTKKDFTHDINKCRKEAKETLFWLKLIASVNPALASKMANLITK
ncbi:MAG: four helix bundle protein [Candidatus Blackburnbacteria bacterium]|nr:four helix bundle protein [Candidatus Blackburnbacteria bacterium]